MNTRVPSRPGGGYSRREFLRQSAGATAFASLAALASKHLATQAVAEEGYTGDLVLVSQVGAAPDKALPKILEAYKAAGPGIKVKTIFYPEEKFVALYTAAQAAGEQIDVLMLNPQDLRRYATSGVLIPFDDCLTRTALSPKHFLLIR